jgi:uncharacterized membrane protein
VITTTSEPALVAVRADDVRLEADDGGHLVHVERLALRQVLDDVDEHDVRVVRTRELERARGADVAAADDRDLSPFTHVALPRLDGRFRGDSMDGPGRRRCGTLPS